MRPINFFIAKAFKRIALLLCMAVLPMTTLAVEPVMIPTEVKKPFGKVRRADPAQPEQRRVKDLIGLGLTLDDYPIALSQAWLDFAREAFYRKDRTAFNEALIEARSVISISEKLGSQAQVVVRIIASSKRLREDLWQRGESYKDHFEFRCAAWAVARMEIALIAAGRADLDMGWRAARPYVQRAERLSRDAESKLKGCVERKSTPVEKKESVPEKDTQAAIPVEVKPAPIVADPTSMPKMPDRVHFGFESAELSDVSALVLEQVSYVLRANPTAVVDLVGYANEGKDSGESDALALARAHAVQEYLIETGVGRERLVVKQGTQDGASDKFGSEKAKGRRVELVPTSSESIPIEYQDKDFMLEGPKG